MTDNPFPSLSYMAHKVASQSLTRSVDYLYQVTWSRVTFKWLGSDACTVDYLDELQIGLQRDCVSMLHRWVETSYFQFAGCRWRVLSMESIHLRRTFGRTVFCCGKSSRSENNRITDTATRRYRTVNVPNLIFGPLKGLQALGTLFLFFSLLSDFRKFPKALSIHNRS